MFRKVWFASLASNFGGMIQNVGASWMMISLAASADVIALVQASTTLPVMLFALAAGAISDNYDRRRIMLAAQGFMFCVSLGLAVSAWFGLLTPWLLLGFTFLIGCGNALNGPAWQSSVGDLVPRPDLPAAITLNSVGFNIARSVGPALGGFIVAALGAVAAFIINATSYVALITVLARWRPPKVERQLPRETLWLIHGRGAALCRDVAEHPQRAAARLRLFRLRRHRGAGAAAGDRARPGQGRPAHLRSAARLLRLRRGGRGLLQRKAAPPHAVHRDADAAVLPGLRGIATAIVSLSTLTCAVDARAGDRRRGWVLALSTFNATVQFSAPRWVVGRALALYQMATFGGMALGAWFWGEAAAWLRARSRPCIWPL